MKSLSFRKATPTANTPHKLQAGSVKKTFLRTKKTNKIYQGLRVDNINVVQLHKSLEIAFAFTFHCIYGVFFSISMEKNILGYF